MPEVRGLILAAGLGTRLRPLTDEIPKPLLPVLGLPLLDRAAAALAAAGCRQLAINTHHLAEQVAQHVSRRPDAPRCHLSHEPEILGTGGALHGARGVLAGADDFVVYNGDVLCDLDVGDLLAAHRTTGARATLAVVDRPAINTVLVAADRSVRDLAGRRARAPQAGDRWLTFTGIACYRRSFLERVPQGPSDLVSVLCALIAEDPTAVRCHLHAGQWEDLGTIDRYLDAHRRLLGPDFVSVPEATMAAPAGDLAECVLLPGATVPAGIPLRRAVVGTGWVVVEDAAACDELALACRAGFAGPTRLQWITGHGSTRRFVRIAAGNRRAVLMTTTPDDPEYQRFLDIAAFLYARGLGAPAVLAHDPAPRQVLLEDLGTDTLETLVHAEPDRATDLYARVLDRLADLQVFGAEARSLCPAAWDRAFDREHLRWETDYFREQFLVGHVGLPPGELTGLDVEFEELAAACLRQPRTLVHRDFQSQNILLKDGMVRLVDVQGMRWGPVAYDVASLLLDPYVELPAALRDDLAASFPERVAARGGPRLAAAAWRDMVRTAGLQRLMQALGAYCFLGHVRQRSAFLQHIPRALRRLGDLVALVPNTGSTEFAPPPLPLLAHHLQRTRNLLDRR